MANVSHRLGSLHWQEQSVSVLTLLILVVQFVFPVSLALADPLFCSCLDPQSQTSANHKELLAFLNRIWVRLEPFHFLVHGGTLLVLSAGEHGCCLVTGLLLAAQ